jgi:ubiquinone/menaquinone biosynthesis C-methylase UbiE
VTQAPLDRLLDATSRAEQRHFWFRGFRRFVVPLLAEAIAGRPRADILDCGCGTGNNLAMLERFGRPYGIDLTWVGLQHARRMGATRTARASVVQLPFATQRFDLVTSFDVLYCLPEPAESQAVTEMYRVLRPGGALVVNVAALDILRGNHSVLGGEVRRYTCRTLRALLERAGFGIERITYTNASLFPVILSVRTAQRLVGMADTPEKAESEIRIPPAPINAVLSAALLVESYALRVIDMPLGSSVLCLARRPPG